MSIFNDNMVATSLLMLLFFGSILLILGKPYLVENEFITADKNFLFYILESALHFTVYLSILQLGVRTFVAELTESFQGIANKLLPGAVPGIDVAANFAFGSPNAVTLGFLFGALGQFLMIILLIVLKAPTIVIAGFIPMFFDNAVIATYANHRGGIKPAVIFPYGGYLGMFDWATVWPGFTIIMKTLGYLGILVVIFILVLIPQLQYRRNPHAYFLITEDYEGYKQKFKKEGVQS